MNQINTIRRADPGHSTATKSEKLRRGPGTLDQGIAQLRGIQAQLAIREDAVAGSKEDKSNERRTARLGRLEDKAYSNIGRYQSKNPGEFAKKLAIMFEGLGHSKTPTGFDGCASPAAEQALIDGIKADAARLLTVSDTNIDLPSEDRVVDFALRWSEANKAFTKAEEIGFDAMGKEEKTRTRARAEDVQREAQDEMDRTYEMILNTPAKSLVGAMAQVALVGHVASLIAGLVSDDDDFAAKGMLRGIYRAVYSAVAAIERATGVHREKLGSDYFLAREHDPHCALADPAAYMVEQ